MNSENKLFVGQNVFISYASVDQELAERVRSELNTIGIRSFFGPKDMRWGDGITGKVKQAISECSAIIVVISSGSHKSVWVPFEVGYAIAAGKNVLPFLAHPSVDPPGYLADSVHVGSLEEVKEYFRKFIHFPGESGIESTAFGPFSGQYIGITWQENGRVLVQEVQCWQRATRLEGKFGPVAFLSLMDLGRCDICRNTATHRFEGFVDQRSFVLSYQSDLPSQHSSGTIVLKADSTGMFCEGWAGLCGDVVRTAACHWVKVSPSISVEKERSKFIEAAKQYLNDSMQLGPSGRQIRFRKFFFGLFEPGKVLLVFPDHVLAAGTPSENKSSDGSPGRIKFKLSVDGKLPFVRPPIIREVPSSPFRNLSFELPEVAAWQDLEALAHVASLFGTLSQEMPKIETDSAVIYKGLNGNNLILFGLFSNYFTDQSLRMNASKFFEKDIDSSGDGVLRLLHPDWDCPGCQTANKKSREYKRAKEGNKGGTDWGLIVKFHPKDHKDKTWIIIAGIGAHGTAGAGKYLASKWETLYNTLDNDGRPIAHREFAAVIRVPGDPLDGGNLDRCIVEPVTTQPRTGTTPPKKQPTRLPSGSKTGEPR